MTQANLLVGPPLSREGAVPVGDVQGRTEVAVVSDAGDRTEYLVAALVLGALGLLVLFRVAGFSAVIATKVSVG